MDISFSCIVYDGWSTRNLYHVMKYRQEFEMYADYALERYLIEKEGYDEYDAKVKVMQDYDEVKRWFEETEKISLPNRSY